MSDKQVDMNVGEPVGEPVQGVGVTEYEISLLSRGKIGLPESVSIKSMTAKEEDILANPTFIRNGTVFNKLLSSVLRTKVDPQKLLAGDRDWILLNARIDAYGNEYPIEISCPECEEKSKVMYSLESVEKESIRIEPDILGENTFTVTTPSGTEITFAFWTVGMQQRLDTYLKNSKNKSPITGKMFIQTLKINGEEDRQTIRDTIESMPAKDSLYIRKYINEHAAGVDMKLDFECENCGHFEGGIEVPMGTSFFWPELD